MVTVPELSVWKIPPLALLPKYASYLGGEVSSHCSWRFIFLQMLFRYKNPPPTIPCTSNTVQEMELDPAYQQGWYLGT